MSNKKIVVIDYGLGNLNSVLRAVEVCGVGNVILSSCADDVHNADSLIIPGVGAFEDGMRGLDDRNLVEPIQQYAKSGRPLMGICLGMQMLATYSSEYGSHTGLNIIPGVVEQLPNVGVCGEIRKSPEIGWRKLHNVNGCENAIFENVDHEKFVYFVHSFEFKPYSSNDLVSYYDAGGYKVAAIIQKGSVYGCQFHPEKSGSIGLSLLRNFLFKN